MRKKGGMNPMRLLICAGGTGGGVYPALAVLQAEKTNDIDVLWVGSDDGIEKDLVKRAGIAYRGIPAAGLHGVNVFSLPGRLIKLGKGYLEARKIIKDFKPDVMFFTGGYVGFPVAMAGKKVPSVLFVPDIEPGVALNALSKNADVITVVCKDSINFFKDPSKIKITGYPTRTDIRQWNRKDALEHFGLDDRLPVLFVFGGSKGARSINHALMGNLAELTGRCQIIHITGSTDWEDMKSFYESQPDDVKNRYKMFPYLHEEMGAAFSAADLIISRAGASTLGEFPLFGVPAILVPYPYAWRYQKVNADYLVSKNAAILIKDEDLPGQMIPTVTDLLDDPEKLAAMKKSMEKLAMPEASANILRILKETASK